MQIKCYEKHGITYDFGNFREFRFILPEYERSVRNLEILLLTAVAEVNGSYLKCYYRKRRV
jgi:hypothetical protein